MRNIFSTVTRKVVIGYLVIVLFSLLAVGFSLTRLHQQTRQTERLVNVDFHAFELLRDLQQNLFAQENIEKQLVILKDPSLRDLRHNRQEEFIEVILELSHLPLPKLHERLAIHLSNYRQVDKKLSLALEQNDWPQVAQISSDLTVPVREHLLNAFSEARQEQQQRINTGLSRLSEDSSEAYRLALLITLIGICLTAPVALTVVISIHRSVKALKQATKEISVGSFDHRPEIPGNNEFAQLAREFSRMGRKLRDLEQLQLDANPLTRLPGNLAIDRELDHRIEQNIPFAHLYIDLDNFKIYSDRYGYKAGSDVLARVGELIQKVAKELCSSQDLIGHIGGDDYVVITSPDVGELVAQKIIVAFEQLSPQLYNKTDREIGSITGADRYGVERTFPLMTMSIAVIRSDYIEKPSRLAISQDCARLKEYLKVQDGSNFLVDRRK